MDRSGPVRRGVAAAVACRLATVLACYLAAMPADADATVYLNQWAVQVDGGPSVADAVAADNGFRNLGQVRFTKSLTRTSTFNLTSRGRLMYDRPWYIRATARTGSRRMKFASVKLKRSQLHQRHVYVTLAKY